MRRLVLFVMLIAAMMLVACSAPEPTKAPAPTAAPAQPTKAPEPTKAPAATTAPAATAAPAQPTKAPEPTKAAAATFDWKQRAGDTLVLYLPQHPWTNAIQPFFPDFEKQTGIKLEVQTFAEAQLRDKVLIALQAKSSEFDFWMSLKSREGLKYYRANYYELLDKYLADPKLTPPDYNVKDFAGGPFGGEKFENKLTGIPIIIEGPVVFYRKDLFDAAKIPAMKKIEDIETAAAACMKANPGITGVTLRGDPNAIAYTFGPFMRAFGVNYRDANGKSQLSSPNGLKAVEYYTKLAREYGPPGVVTYSFAQSSALFGGGNACMEIESSNELSTIIDPKSSKVIGKVGVMPYPPGPGGDVPTVLQWGVSINANSKKKEAAWLFTMWATSQEMQTKLQLKGIASPRSSSWDSADWKAQLAGDALRAEWAAAVKYVAEKGSGEVGPPAIEQPAARKIMGDALDAVILGTKSAADAMKAADAELDKVER
ncbi:MAG: sugar ABC transporter substrate-binding protein [Chloroflexi bacterium]|nr:sugar ABC transporter substrate-binding protein [Chloroflexota bacterium]